MFLARPYNTDAVVCRPAQCDSNGAGGGGGGGEYFEIMHGLGNF